MNYILTFSFFLILQFSFGQVFPPREFAEMKRDGDFRDIKIKGDIISFKETLQKDTLNSDFNDRDFYLKIRERTFEGNNIISQCIKVLYKKDKYELCNEFKYKNNLLIIDEVPNRTIITDSNNNVVREEYLEKDGCTGYRIFKYDNLGNRISELYQQPCDSTAIVLSDCTFDTLARLTSQVWYDYDKIGVPTHSIYKKYNSDGRLILIRKLGKNEKLRSYDEYIYKEDTLIRENNYDSDSTLRNWSLYKYNIQGDIVEIREESLGWKKNNIEIWKFEYKYDEFKNWFYKKTVKDEKVISTTKREVIYK